MTRRSGEYKNLDMAEYHLDEAISKTGLCDLIDRPSRYERRKKSLETSPSKPTAAMALGTLVHALVLEHDEVEKRYVTVDVASKVAKKYKDAVLSEAHRVVLTKPEMQLAKAMADSLKASKTLSKIFEMGGASEVSFFWDKDGVMLKARPDFVTDGGAVVVDVKTCRDASPNIFGKDAYNMRYPLSAALTGEGVKIVRNLPEYPLYVFAAVESTPPFDCAFYAIEYGTDAWNMGQRWLDQSVGIFRECRTQNRYPGLPEKIIPLPLPRYAYS